MSNVTYSNWSLEVFDNVLVLWLLHYSLGLPSLFSNRKRIQSLLITVESVLWMFPLF